MGRAETTAEAAARITQIQLELVSGRISPLTRFVLIKEQREIWDTKFPGVPFEQIVAKAKPRSFMLAT